VYDARQQPVLPLTLDNSTVLKFEGSQLPRLRQAVLAAGELDAVVASLTSVFGLGEPFADSGVGLFGLRNAVFAIGDTFLEVISPVTDGTSAGRLLARRGGDCGYMVMFEVEDLGAARERAAALGIREVFEVSLDDIDEAHLHPADMGGAIVALSEPRPHGSWRWGGPGWAERSVDGSVVGVSVAVADPAAVADRWRTVIGGLPGIEFVADERELGPVSISVRTADGDASLQVGSSRVVSADSIGGAGP
jgi:hypothetical protein